MTPKNHSGNSEKPDGYYNNARREIIPLLPSRSGRLLDIGCGEGVTSAWLKARQYCTWICGVELFPAAAAIARTRLDVVYEGNIEHMELPLEPGSIDLILCLDVLEHLVDPWTVLSRLAPLLSPGGTIIASIPNIRCLKVVAPLLVLGRWDYHDAGILDRTHLRFFTRRSAMRLLQPPGLDITKVRPHFGRYARLLNLISLTLFSDFLATQFLIAAQKKMSG